MSHDNISSTYTAEEIMNNFLAGIMYTKNRNKKTLNIEKDYKFYINEINNTEVEYDNHRFFPDNLNNYYNLTNSFINFLIYNLTHSLFSIDRIISLLTSVQLPRQSNHDVFNNMSSEQLLSYANTELNNHLDNIEQYYNILATEQLVKDLKYKEVIDCIFQYIAQELSPIYRNITHEHLLYFQKKYLQTNLLVNLSIIAVTALSLRGFTVISDNNEFYDGNNLIPIHIDTVNNLLKQTLPWLLPLTEICINPEIVPNKYSIIYSIMYACLYSAIPATSAIVLFFHLNLTVTSSFFGLLLGISGLPLLMVAFILLGTAALILACTGATKGYTLGKQQDYHDHLKLKFLNDKSLSNTTNFENEDEDTDNNEFLFHNTAL